MTSRLRAATAISALVACVLAALSPAHAQSTKAQLNTTITTNFPDNTVGAITPAGLRQVTSGIVNSIMPTAPVVSGNLACFSGTTGLLQDCGVSPSSVFTALSGDCTATVLSVITCTKTNGTAFSTLATTVPGAGVATFLGTPSSANFFAALTTKTGSGNVVFSTSPNISAPTGIVKGDVGLGNVANVDTTNASNISSGTLPAARTNGHMNGTATNDSAAGGEVGEYIESNIASGSAITAGATGIAKNLTSISLTAGDWDVTGMIAWVPASTTQLTAHGASVSLVTGTADVTFGRNSTMTLPSAVVGVGNTSNSNVVMPSRFSVSTTTTVFLVGTALYTTAGLNMYGNLRARRAR